jgi:hypothetical protein
MLDLKSEKWKVSKEYMMDEINRADTTEAAKAITNFVSEKPGYIEQSTTYIDVSKFASVFNNDNASAANIVLLLREIPIAKAASIWANAGLTDAKLASILHDANLPASKINSIITNDAISDSVAQKRLNATDCSIRNLTTTVASVIYTIHDDWADNKLTVRDDRATTPASVLGANQFAQKFRPEWAGNMPVSDGRCYLANQGGAYCQIPSSIAYGTWQIKQRYNEGTDIGLNWSTFTIIWPDTSVSSYYYTEWGTKRDQSWVWDNLTLRRADTGTDTIILDTLTTPSSGVWYTVKTTRTTAGLFEVFIDGVSKGTVIDNTYTTCAALKLYGYTAWGSSTLSFDDLVVIK